MTLFKVSMTRAAFDAYIAVPTNTIPANYEIFISDAAAGTPNLYTGTGTNTPVSGNVGGISGGGTIFEDWVANKAYAIADKAIATALVGNVGIGSRLRRKTAGTSRADFDATEVLAWDEMVIDDDVVPKTAIKSAFLASPLDTNIASEKLVKDHLDLKSDDAVISRVHGQALIFTRALAHPVNFASNAGVTGTDGAYSASASSEFSSSYQAWQAFDNVDTTDHATQGVTGATEWHIQLNMPVGKIISRVLARGRHSGVEGPTAFRIEGSNDSFVTKTTLHTGTMVLNNTAQTFDFTNTKLFKAYRFVATASSGTNPGLSRLEFHESVYAPSAHTHAQSDISSLTADLALKSPLASPAFTGTPTVPTSTAGDSSTKVASTAFVTDSVIASQAGLDFKQSVRAATGANITLSGTQTIDGIAIVAGDRVLVKNQTTASQNGIYDAATGTWTRSSDANAANEVSAGMYAFVESGTVNAGKSFVLTTTGNIVLNTTALAFAEFPNTSGKEDTTNKVTVFSSPTDTQYPSAKLVNDQLALKAAATHAHDDLYFTEAEVNNQFMPKSSLIVTPTVIHPENFAATTATGTAGTYTVSASSEFSGTYAGWKCFDGSDTTDWATLGVTSNFWVRMVLPAARIVTSIIVRGRNSGIERITNWVFQGSNDGTNWTALLSSTTVLGNTALTITIPNSTAYTQYRLFANTAEAPNPGLSRLTLRADGFSFNNPTV